MHDFDVAVVGGGCSGLWAARAASRGGARTLLVEKATRVGERIVCAEGVGADGISELLDLEDDWVAASIEGARLFSPDGGVVEFAEPGCGFILNKEIFLRGLSVMVAEDGVEMWLASEVREVRIMDSGGVELRIDGPDGNRSITAGAVVAADGIEASIARQVGLHEGLRPEELFSCAQYTVAPIDVDRHVVEFHFGREVAPGGYAWVFPKGDSIANIGVGIIPGVSGTSSPSEYLRRFRERRCAQARTLGFVVGGVPTVRNPYIVSKGGVFPAGDAAAVADPVSGAGIVPGMESAAIAGEYACRYATDKAEGHVIEKEFTRKLNSLFRDRSLRFAVRKVLSMMDDKQLARMVVATGEYVSQGSVLRGDPFRVVKFLVKVMPNTFGVIKHMVRV